MTALKIPLACFIFSPIDTLAAFALDAVNIYHEQSICISCCRWDGKREDYRTDPPSTKPARFFVTWPNSLCKPTHFSFSTQLHRKSRLHCRHLLFLNPHFQLWISAVRTERFHLHLLKRLMRKQPRMSRYQTLKKCACSVLPFWDLFY